jgi:hypothetical protein
LMFHEISSPKMHRSWDAVLQTLTCETEIFSAIQATVHGDSSTSANVKDLDSTRSWIVDSCLITSRIVDLWSQREVELKV